MMSRNVAFHVTLALAGIAAGSNATRAYAHGQLPRDTPIDRLVKNLEARLEKAPDNAYLHYVLGRLHALAFETKNENVPVFLPRHRNSADEIEGFEAIETKYWVRRARDNNAPKVPNADELREHLRQAVIHLNRAIELAPTIASYRLALASILESGESMARSVDVIPLRPAKNVDELPAPGRLDSLLTKFKADASEREGLLELLHRSVFGTTEPSDRDWIVLELDHSREAADPGRRSAVRELLFDDWREQTTAQYFLALVLALPTEGAVIEKPMWVELDAFIAYEAGSAYVRIVESRGARPEDAVRLATAKAAIKAFDDLPLPSGVTPILFSLAAARPLADLLEPGATTTFDLDGTGRVQRWPWVAHDTGILVWDPLKSGRITSGRQLFGSVSWWLFFKNGYDALAALDDDGDGELSGRELDGLAVWFDRNGNGQSDPGEVVPVGELGITGLSCHATEMTDESPCNPRGLRLSTGAILPTYDWITRPLPKAPAVSGAPGTAAPRSGA